MTKLNVLKNMLEFISEMFPPDLAAITLSDCSKFIAVWNREDEIGKAIGKALYPGKLLDDKVMLGQVVKYKKKRTHYFSSNESVCKVPYLAVGIPIYEDGILTGGICIIREDTILETQARCRSLLQVNGILSDSMHNASGKMDELLQSYDKTRKIVDLMQQVNHKATMVQVNSVQRFNGNSNIAPDNHPIFLDSIKEMANETQEAALQIIKMLNEFDVHAASFFAAIKNIQVIVDHMGAHLTDISEFITEQSNSIINHSSKADD